MAGRDLASDYRGPTRTYTPSMDSEEDIRRMSSLSLSDRDYRLFKFTKDGRSWADAHWNESTVSENEIRKRAKNSKKPTHSVGEQLMKMSVPRRAQVQDLLDRLEPRNIGGDQWKIVSIHNDRPEHTKRTGEVLNFSVILARVIQSRTRTGSGSQERRRSTYLISAQEFIVPERRGSKAYHHQGSLYDDKSGRQSFRNSQTIIEDDPFNNTNLFSSEGKPLDAHGSAPLTNAGLPAHIPLDRPIGAKSEPRENEGKKLKKSKGGKAWKTDDDEVVDLDALLHNVDDEDSHDHHHQGRVSFDDFDGEGIEVVDDEYDSKPRGRGRNDSGVAWPPTARRQSRSKSKSKSRPRRPSIHIPKDSYGRAIPEIIPAGRRQRQRYWGPDGSATDPSIHSDQSVLEAEYEDYSSSGSSAAYDQVGYWQGGYMPKDGRYTRATKDHRRGPPSPQQFRGEESYHRRPRAERFASDGAVERYGYTNTPASATRGPLVTQYGVPRFTPTVAYPATSAFNYDTSIMSYPDELSAAPPRRRESFQAQQAELHMQREREFAVLRREQEVAEREARAAQLEQQHHEVSRRASVRQGQSKYNHEPRLTSRYTSSGMDYHG